LHLYISYILYIYIYICFLDEREMKRETRKKRGDGYIYIHTKRVSILPALISPFSLAVAYEEMISLYCALLICLFPTH
jgi:hypothetical protein